ncbi:hypothetical protein GCM10027614_31470 [Micromonospora vulcania]
MALQTRPQAQKMTPKATAITEATTMSMVRQRLVVLSMLDSQFKRKNQEKTHAARPVAPDGGAAGGRPNSCAGITQIRFEGLRACPHSQRCALPCRM